MKDAFVAKQFLYEPTFLVIADPTSLVMKNVTPYCSQIFEVLELFKSCHVRLAELQEECLAELRLNTTTGTGSEINIKQIDAIIEQVLNRNVGSDETVISKFLGMLDVKKCSHSLEE